MADGCAVARRTVPMILRPRRATSTCEPLICCTTSAALECADQCPSPNRRVMSSATALRSAAIARASRTVAVDIEVLPGMAACEGTEHRLSNGPALDASCYDPPVRPHRMLHDTHTMAQARPDC